MYINFIHHGVSGPRVLVSTQRQRIRCTHVRTGQTSRQRSTVPCARKKRKGKGIVKKVKGAASRDARAPDDGLQGTPDTASLHLQYASMLGLDPGVAMQKVKERTLPVARRK
jgi:hypothetical protein